MLTNFDLETFIAAHVTGRSVSLLAQDLEQQRAALQAALVDRNVLVIGGAGTIGSAYIKALLQFRIAGLCVIDLNENGLAELVRDLRSTTHCRVPERFATYPVGLGTPVFEKIVRALGPFHVVANFAAHKHVRSEKDIFSIEAMVENNVLRTRQLLALLAERPPEHFFCVSTDKAANPVNIMGATKKLMEEFILAYAEHFPVSTARFANVAFSNGSLPLGFIERLGKRQPWSCPLGIRRYFVSPREAGELCLIASVVARTGEILFPQLDPARDLVSFSDIALKLLSALRLEAETCATEEEARLKASALETMSPRYPVHFFESDTSGEKPAEEFHTDGEEVDLKRFGALGVIVNARRPAMADIDAVGERLRRLFSTPAVTKAELVEVLRTYLPTFGHIEKGKHLDQRM